MNRSNVNNVIVKLETGMYKPVYIYSFNISWYQKKNNKISLNL